jgi:hypothetical protein
VNDDEKQIIFHVGTIKTASTHIQKFLFENKAQLSSLDVDYILLTPPRLDLPRYANADLIIDNDFDVQHVKNLIRASPCRHIIISEEGLMGRPESIKSEAFAAYSRTAIMYVRPPVDLVASWATENSRPYNFQYIQIAEGAPAEEEGVLAVAEVNSTSMGPCSGIGYLCFTYGQLIDGFLSTVEADEKLKFVIRPYGQDQFMHGNILVDFFNAIGLGSKLNDGLLEIIENYDVAQTNESWSRKYCDVSAKTARLVEKYNLEEIYGEPLVEFVFERCASGDDRKVIETLSDVEMETIFGSLQPFYQRLCANGYGEAVDLQSMLPIIHGDGRRAYQPVDDQEIKRAAIEFLDRGGRTLPDGTELAMNRTEQLYKDFGMQIGSSIIGGKELGMDRTNELYNEFGMQNVSRVELSEGDEANFSLGIVSVRYDDLPWIAKKIAKRFNESRIFWDNPFTGEAVLAYLREFYEQYLPNVPANMRGVQGSTSDGGLLAGWLLLKHLRPDYYVESGVFIGSSLRLADMALPDAQKWAYDLSFNPLLYKEESISYIQNDIGAEPPSLTRGKLAYAFFDDHIDPVKRILSCAELGVEWVEFDDCPTFPRLYFERYPAVPSISMILDEDMPDGTVVEYKLFGRAEEEILRYTHDKAYCQEAKDIIIGHIDLHDAMQKIGVECGNKVAVRLRT